MATDRDICTDRESDNPKDSSGGGGGLSFNIQGRVPGPPKPIGIHTARLSWILDLGLDPAPDLGSWSRSSPRILDLGLDPAPGSWILHLGLDPAPGSRPRSKIQPWIQAKIQDPARDPRQDPRSTIQPWIQATIQNPRSSPGSRPRPRIQDPALTPRAPGGL